ncbi:MAG: leucyl/phenylalanyl-tRNA--protein transferase [Flavobacteriales bacterium]|jgi:leucyl/phenylalanyl-tRNA--protein transferase
MFDLPKDPPWHNGPWFPEHELADDEGLLMIGGALNTDWLLLAYNSGIFPWFSEGQPILWWTPDPRMVVKPEEVYVSKSMRKILRRDEFQVTYNQNFKEVIMECQQIRRDGQPDTWITNDMIEAYVKLHAQGHASSVEVWQDGQLVGGLYGVDLKKQGVFCGESMFSKVSNASKVAFITLSRKLKEEKYHLIDCQLHTDHLESLGAYEIPRKAFLQYLK